MSLLVSFIRGYTELINMLKVPATLIFVISHEGEKMLAKVPSHCGVERKCILMIMHVHKEEREKTSQSTLAWWSGFGNTGQGCVLDTSKRGSEGIQWSTAEKTRSEGRKALPITHLPLLWFHGYCQERFSARGLHKRQQSCDCRAEGCITEFCFLR